MAAILTNLRTTVHVSLALAILFVAAYVFSGAIPAGDALWTAIARWTHVVSGIMWIGLLWYFNFVQIPTMPEYSRTSRNRPSASIIAPKALFWFRWGALAFTVLTGLDRRRT